MVPTVRCYFVGDGDIMLVHNSKENHSGETQKP